MAKREQFGGKIECVCGAKGHATYEENREPHSCCHHAARDSANRRFGGVHDNKRQDILRRLRRTCSHGCLKVPRGSTANVRNGSKSTAGLGGKRTSTLMDYRASVSSGERSK